MKIVEKGEKTKVITFEDLEEGECFREDGETQLQIKTDEESGVCLTDGVINKRDDDTKVIRVDCELRIL